jgi:hypothetical protein
LCPHQAAVDVDCLESCAKLSYLIMQSQLLPVVRDLTTKHRANNVEQTDNKQRWFKYW